MKLNIKFDAEANLVKIGFAKEIIEVYLSEEDSVKNTTWNTKDINSFLIKLSAATPAEEEINVEYDKEVDNKVYAHIVDIFSAFANAYNSTVK